jgi:LysM repeat protein
VAEPTFAQTTPHDIADIPAYVIQPRGSNNRYHAPRLSRTALTLRELRDLQRRSWSQRLLDGWRRQQGQAAPVADELVTELRYQSSARAPIYRPVGAAPTPLHNSYPETKRPSRARRMAGKTAVFAALCVSAGALGWTIGSQMQPAQASSPRMVPASVLICGQNLPTKLPKIEQKASADGGLEQGHRAARITYTVAAGDTFNSIGHKFGLTPRTVRLANQLALGSRLRPGQTLVITAADGAIITSQVGDTLEYVATRYGMKVSAI